MGLPQRQTEWWYVVAGVGAVVLVVVVVLVIMLVAIPAANRAWLESARMRDTSQARPIQVVLVCNGDLTETQSQIANLYRSAWWPDFVWTTVVTHDHDHNLLQVPDPRRNARAKQHPVQTLNNDTDLSGLLGKEQLNLKDRITFIDLAHVPEGTLAAFQTAREYSAFNPRDVCVFLDCGVVLAEEWDRTLVNTFSEIHKHVPQDGVCHVVTQERCPGTLPPFAQTWFLRPATTSAAAKLRLPVAYWRPMKQSPHGGPPVQQTVVGTAFMALESANLSRFPKTSECDLRNAPSFGCFVLTHWLQTQGCMLWAPQRNVARPSPHACINTNIYTGVVQTHAASLSSNKAAFARMYEQLHAIPDGMMGLQWSERTTYAQGWLGLGTTSLPPFLVRDISADPLHSHEVLVKWGSYEDALTGLYQNVECLAVQDAHTLVSATLQLFGMDPKAGLPAPRGAAATSTPTTLTSDNTPAV